MRRLSLSRFRGFQPVFGLLLAALALVGHIAVAGVAMQAADDVSADAISILCQAEQPAPAKHAPLHQDGGLTCLACQSLADAGSTLLPSLVFFPHVPPGLVLHGPRLHGARAPPARVLASAYPTGPPIRI